ncbi:vesicle-associated membrane protein 3-like isoform X2 [Rhodnius prolixus]|uniref:Putative vesicle-associated membrane protein 2 n=1 Tax=Rhodnius prolixus TaxID=13249 RepID=R4G4E1_RHOPR
MEGTGNTGESSGGKTQKTINETQAHVDEVVGIMRVNIEKVLERDQRLSDLDDRAEALNMSALKFEQQAAKLKRKMWWRNVKYWLVIGAIVGVLLLIIIVSTTSGGESSNSNSGNTGN